MENISSLHTLLHTSRKVCIISHTNPDGDAIGSITAMASYISRRCGADAVPMVPDRYPANLSFIARGSGIIVASEHPQKAEDDIRTADLIIVQDLNDLRRTEQLRPLIEASPAPKVMIDHHLYPDTGHFKLVFSDPERSSTCELLYFILKDLEGGVIKRIPAAARLRLMTGMTTDTNNFANSTGPDTLIMAEELLASGVDRDYILDHIYHSDRPERLAAMADMLSTHLTMPEKGISCMVMTADMYKKYRLKDGETDSLVNFPLHIAKVKLSIFAREENGVFRVSIRSKKGWSANRMATEYFHGGGHELAAGGKILIPLDIDSADDVHAYLKEVAARFLRNRTSLSK